MLLGVDVGGTFTDAVLVVDGQAITAKAPTTPDDQSRGVLDAVRAALERRVTVWGVERVPECGDNEEVLRAHGLDADSLVDRLSAL